jgi:hypothetical protein
VSIAIRRHDAAASAEMNGANDEALGIRKRLAVPPLSIDDTCLQSLAEGVALTGEIGAIADKFKV